MSKSNSNAPDGRPDSVEALRRRIEEKIDELDRRLSVEERRLAERENAARTGRTEDSPDTNESGGPSKQ